MKITKIFTLATFLLTVNFCLGQVKTDSLTFQDFNNRSFEFIEFVKSSDNFNGFNNWCENGLNEKILKTLSKLKEISKNYPDGVEITVIAYGKIPLKNKPLEIIYNLKDIDSKNEFGVLLNYRDDGNLLIDKIDSIKLTDLLKDTLRNPLPMPPKNKNK
ncbi:hypothetical protein Q2T40_08495 [Winogradskyella maritima]|uniref:DUF4252 domain-containing protein n=1 Tax=Winogradskyella maritima TaxID=1517766 RepID=A0ABV8ALE5_9FLAO|nr:hypothetical protein [Winogradskyella maritima]